MTACPKSPLRSPGPNGTVHAFLVSGMRLCRDDGVIASVTKRVRCAIYTRVSTEAGLDQDFNSLDAQYDAAQAYIRSQAHAGWTLVRTRYDDGGFSGGSTDRPALQHLLADVKARKINVIVVYKVDRLTRSLADFAKLVELFDANGVSFVSVTQQFNTTTSMGRLTLNVLLSFAQFEREVTAERIRDKIAASKRKGLCLGQPRHWLDELIGGTVTNVEQIAAREKCSIRQVNRTITLAFIAPTLVQATAEGRLPRGIGVATVRISPLNGPANTRDLAWPHKISSFKAVCAGTRIFPARDQAQISPGLASKRPNVENRASTRPR